MTDTTENAAQAAIDRLFYATVAYGELVGAGKSDTDAGHESATELGAASDAFNAQFQSALKVSRHPPKAANDNNVWPGLVHGGELVSKFTPPDYSRFVASAIFLIHEHKADC